MKRTVNWGILGAAAIATGKVLPAIKESPSTTVLAIASRDSAKGRAAAQAHGIPRVYGAYEELLQDPDVEVVYIPLPNHLHFEWAARSLEAGKHVLCEKPLCLSAYEAAQLCGARDRAHRRIEEGFAFRNHPQWEKVDELLSSNAIGAVRAVHVLLAKQFFDPKDIRNIPSVGGGALYDLGSYAVCVCNMIFRRSAQRAMGLMNRDPGFGTDRLTTAILDYGDGHATFTVASQAGPNAWATHQQLTVVGATGWLRFDFPYSHGRPTACSIELGDASSIGSFPTSTFRFEPVNQYGAQVERFSRLILGEDVRSWPIEESVSILRTIDALFESSRNGRWILLN